MAKIDDAKQIVESWMVEKTLGRSFDQRDMRKFIELMNDRTKAFIRAMDSRSVAYFQFLAREAEDCQSFLTPGAKLVELGIVGTRRQRAQQVVQQFEVWEPEFYVGVMELSIHACTLLTPRARVFADGVDRTNV